MESNLQTGMTKTRQALRACGRWISHSLDILKASIIRLVFALHATIAIVRITITQGDYWYLMNMCGVNFLLIELIVTVVKRKGEKRVSRLLLLLLRTTKVFL